MQFLKKGKEKIDSYDFFGLLKTYNINSAIKDFQEALEIFKTEKNLVGMHQAVYYIGLCYEELKDVDQAVYFYTEASKIIEPIDHEKAISILKYAYSSLKKDKEIAERIASIYYKYHLYDDAIIYYKEALEIEKVADILVLQKEYKQAEMLYEELIEAKNSSILGKWLCNELILKAVFCSFFTHSNPILLFNFYNLKYPKWIDTEEYRFAKQIIESIQNRDSMGKAIKDYSKLSDWHVNVLFELKTENENKFKVS